MKNLFIIIAIIITQNQYAQQSKPKLIVGIVIDQMRYDYLKRFDEKFGNKGFNRIIKEGISFENAHYNYIPTYTAVGHTSIYTGATPKSHGIIGNNWYDKFEQKYIYCVDDNQYKTVGSITAKAGKKSPKRLIATTLADQLKLDQGFKGKTIGLAIKDRSAILPVGRSANAAYWYDGDDNGKWITSSYYMNQLPEWLIQYNTKNIEQLDEYLSEPWETIKKIDDYDESIMDDNRYEGVLKGEKKPVFPHAIHELKSQNGDYNIIKNTPYGNSITLDFAEKVIKNEKLGDTDYTDFLAISLSSTDYIGHQYGAASKEIEDTYIRLNKELDGFIDYLNKKVGQKNYVLFLTADHAVADIPNYLKDHKIHADYISSKNISKKLKTFLKQKYGSDDLIEHFSNYQVFLNKEEIKKLNLNIKDIEQAIVDEAINYDLIHKAIGAHTLQQSEFHRAPLSLLQQGYNQKLSGDVLLITEPAIISDGYSKSGTTHGSGYSYDTHIPLIFYGAGIQKNQINREKVNITQIAPTIANILQIEQPNMASDEILDVFEINITP